MQGESPNVREDDLSESCNEVPESAGRRLPIFAFENFVFAEDKG